MSKERNIFQKDMDDLREWQENQYNPGYYIGTGRTKMPLANLTSQPLLLLIIGILGLVSVLTILILSDATILDLLFPMILPTFFIVGGALRLKNSKK
jgi:hypothetical protein